MLFIVKFFTRVHDICLMVKSIRNENSGFVFCMIFAWLIFSTFSAESTEQNYFLQILMQERYKFWGFGQFSFHSLLDGRQWPKLQFSQSAEAEQSAMVKFGIWPITEAEADYWIFLEIYKVYLTKLYLICRFMQLN